MNSSKSSTGSIWAAVLVTAVVVGGGVFAYFQHMNDKEVDVPGKIAELEKQVKELTDEKNEDKDEPTKTEEAEEISLKSLDDQWNLYTNRKLGIELKVPKKTENATKCIEEKTIDDRKTFGGEVMPTEVKVFEAENGVIIAPGSFVHMEYETIKPSEAYAAISCEEINSSADLLNTAVFDAVPGWNITVADAKTDEEIDTFIKKIYGSGCSYTKAVATDDPDVMNIDFEGDGKTLENTDCPVNFVLQVKHSPKLGKIATWGIGHDSNFWLDGKDFDMEMSESFRFVQ